MSKRQRITYPTGQAQSVASEKYHVGSIVFLPFVITDDNGDDTFFVETSHPQLQNYDGGMLSFSIPKEILT